MLVQVRTQKKVSAGGWKTVSCLLTGVVSDAPPSFQARRRCRCKCFFTGVDAEDIYQCQGIDADMNGHTGVCVFMSVCVCVSVCVFMSVCVSVSMSCVVQV